MAALVPDRQSASSSKSSHAGASALQRLPPASSRLGSSRIWIQPPWESRAVAAVQPPNVLHTVSKAPPASWLSPRTLEDLCPKCVEPRHRIAWLKAASQALGLTGGIQAMSPVNQRPKTPSPPKRRPPQLPLPPKTPKPSTASPRQPPVVLSAPPRWPPAPPPPRPPPKPTTPRMRPTLVPPHSPSSLPDFDLVRRSLAKGQLETQGRTGEAMAKDEHAVQSSTTEVGGDDPQLAWVQAIAGTEASGGEDPEDQRVFSHKRRPTSARLSTLRDRARNVSTPKVKTVTAPDDTKWWLPPEGTTSSFLRRGHGDTTRAKLLDSNIMRVSVSARPKQEDDAEDDVEEGDDEEAQEGV